MVNRLYCAVLAALMLTSGLGLAACAADNRGAIPMEDAQSCTRQTFPQCGVSGSH
jgi:hypothetical protein